MPLFIDSRIPRLARLGGVDSSYALAGFLTAQNTYATAVVETDSGEVIALNAWWLTQNGRSGLPNLHDAADEDVAGYLHEHNRFWFGHQLFDELGADGAHKTFAGHASDIASRTTADPGPLADSSVIALWPLRGFSPARHAANR